MRLYVISAFMIGSANLALAQPTQWRTQDGGNGHWYQTTGTTVHTWEQARDAAIAQGGNLVVFTTDEEHAFLEANLGWDGPPGLHGYVGLYQDRTAPDYSEPDGGWRWVTGEPLQRSPWAEGYPNNDGGGQDYGINYGDFRLDDWSPGTCCTPGLMTIEWSADCNGDGIVDKGQILSGQLPDANGNGVPDICDMPLSADVVLASGVSPVRAYSGGPRYTTFAVNPYQHNESVSMFQTFTEADFTAAQNAPDATVLTLLGLWNNSGNVPGGFTGANAGPLNSSLARWVHNSSGDYAGQSVLFAVPFDATTTQVDITLSFLSDNGFGNRLGANNQPTPAGYGNDGVFVNGVSLGYCAPGGPNQPLQYDAVNTITFTDVPTTIGQNWLYLYQFNWGGPGGSAFTAEINMVDTPSCPVITAQPQSAAWAPGSNVTFMLDVAGPASGFQWRFNGTPLADGPRVSGSDSPTLTITNIRNSDQGSYDCVVTSLCDSIASEVALLSCRPVIVAQPPARVPVAPGLEISISVPEGAFYTYRWRQNGQNLFNTPGLLSGVTTRTLRLLSNDPSLLGEYDCVLTNSCGTTISSATVVYCFADYDYNQDENVDLVDAQDLAQVFVGQRQPEDYWLDGDVNGDENVDLTDAQLLAAFVVSGVCPL